MRVINIKSLKPGLQYVNKREIYLPGIKSVVLLGDNGCRAPTKESITVFSKILKIKTDFFIIVGDLVLRGQGKEFRRLFRFCRKKTRAPIFTLVGNHDLPEYSKFCGLSTYTLILDNFVIACLDDSRRHFRDADLAFLKKELKEHKEKKFIILFHIAPPTQIHLSCIEDSEWQGLKEVLDRLKKRITCIFSGHIHTFNDYRLDGYRIFITGGGGSALFDLENDPLKAHHAIKLEFSERSTVAFNAIPIDGKITKAAKKYLAMKLK